LGAAVGIFGRGWLDFLLATAIAIASNNSWPNVCVNIGVCVSSVCAN